MKNKVRILSTALLEPSLINMAMEQNIIIDAIPFIEIQTVTDKNLSETIKDLFSQKLNVVFTSVNAVEAARIIMPEAKPEWTIFCVEGNTQKAVREYFGGEIKGTGKDADSLAQAIINEGSIKDVTFFCGNIRRDELPDKLNQAGVNVKEIFVYNTTQTPQAITEQYDAILFFSPSGVNSFFSVNKIKPDTVLFALGNTTANVIKGRTENKIIVCDSPSKKEMVTKALQYFQKQLITD